MYLYQKCLGLKGNWRDDVFRDCANLETLFDRLLLDTSPMRAMFLSGTSTGLGNLAESYVAILLESEWMPRPGFDVCTILEYRDGPEAATVQVRSVSPYSYTNYDSVQVHTVDSTGILNADHLVAVVFEDTFNPCYSRIFAIPKMRIEGQKNLWISKHPIHRQNGTLNSYWEYEVPNHVALKQQLKTGKQQSMPFIQMVFNFDSCLGKNRSDD
jgi:hypothetical protein